MYLIYQTTSELAAAKVAVAELHSRLGESKDPVGSKPGLGPSLQNEEHERLHNEDQSKVKQPLLRAQQHSIEYGV